jgi:hypothetical protein
MLPAIGEKPILRRGKNRFYEQVCRIGTEKKPAKAGKDGGNMGDVSRNKKQAYCLLA